MTLNRMRNAAVALSALALISACSSSTTATVPSEAPAASADSSAAAPASAAAAPAADCTYYWMAANITNPFYVEGLKGWNDAAEELGVKAELVGPQDADVTQQVSQLEQMIASKEGTCGVLVYAVDYKAMTPVLTKLREAGIPVVNGNGDSEDTSLRNAFVGTDNAALGRSAAGLACKSLNGKGTVGVVSFITAQNHQERVAGFEEGIKAGCPDVKILPVSPNDGTAEGAFAAANGLITANPDVNLIWATDAGSPGVARAVKERDLVGKVLVIGTDRTPEQIAAIKDKTVLATITQATEVEEYISLHYLKWLNEGKGVPDVTITPAFVIDASNVDTLS